MAEGIAVNSASNTAHALLIGILISVTAERYASDWALRQFYFHLETDYVILRAKETELCEADMPRLLAHAGT